MLRSVPSLAEGSVFAAMNPRHDSQTPHSGNPSSPDRNAVHVVNPRTYGVVEFENGTGWVPKKIDSTPPSVTCGMGTIVSVQLALAYNASEHAAAKGRWMLVTGNGETLILCGIKGDDRPSDPAAFPECIRAGLTRHESDDIRSQENELRFKLARVPRSWTVAVRPTDLSGTREGGEA